MKMVPLTWSAHRGILSELEVNCCFYSSIPDWHKRILKWGLCFLLLFMPSLPLSYLSNQPVLRDPQSTYSVLWSGVCPRCKTENTGHSDLQVKTSWFSSSMHDGCISNHNRIFFSYIKHPKASCISVISAFGWRQVDHEVGQPGLQNKTLISIK